MQKIKGIVCYGAAALLSILNLAWFALDYAVMKVSSVTIGAGSVYDLLKNVDVLTGDAKTSMVFAIITLVLGCLLAVGCVLGLLNQLGILKVKFVAIVNYVLAGLTVAASLLAMVMMIVALGSGASVGAGLILPFVFAVVSLVGVILANVNLGKKDAQ